MLPPDDGRIVVHLNLHIPGEECTRRLRAKFARTTSFQEVYANFFHNYNKFTQANVPAVKLSYEVPGGDDRVYDLSNDVDLGVLLQHHSQLSNADSSKSASSSCIKVHVRPISLHRATGSGGHGTSASRSTRSGIPNADRSSAATTYRRHETASHVSFLTDPISSMHSLRSVDLSDDSSGRPREVEESYHSRTTGHESAHSLAPGALALSEHSSYHRREGSQHRHTRSGSNGLKSAGTADPDWVTDLDPSAIMADLQLNDNFPQQLLMYKHHHLMGETVETPSSRAVSPPSVEYANPRRVARSSSVAQNTSPYDVSETNGAHDVEKRAPSGSPQAAQSTGLPAKPGLAKPGLGLGLKIEVGSQMQHAWGADGQEDYMEDAAKAKEEEGEAPDVPLSLQIIPGRDLKKVRELGRGQFGSVWRCTWRGVLVAVKELHAATTPHNLRQMLQEAETMAVMQHPCIVAFYGVVTDSPSPMTVMEFMRDGALASKLQYIARTAGNLPAVSKVAIALQAARGMEYLHRNLVIHFDLKCENLLCDLRDLSAPVVKVSDLGLSKQKATTFVSGNMRGTLPWMAPELFPSGNEAAGSRVTEKVDVFSFGVVLWEIWMMGSAPYEGKNMGQVVGGIMQGTLRPPIPSDCDPAWTQLMQDCWHTQPRHRPSFSDIAERLELIQEHYAGPVEY